MNHVPVSSVARSFTASHDGVAMMTEWRIKDLGVTDGGVNILVL